MPVAATWTLAAWVLGTGERSASIFVAFVRAYLYPQISMLVRHAVYVCIIAALAVTYIALSPSVFAKPLELRLKPAQPRLKPARKDVRCAIFDSTDKHALECANGVITRVLFASFGTAALSDGKCAFQAARDGCVRTDMQAHDVVAYACLGRAKCTLNMAMWNMLSAPCVDITPYVSVVWTCAPPPPRNIVFLCHPHWLGILEMTKRIAKAMQLPPPVQLSSVAHYSPAPNAAIVVHGLLPGLSQGLRRWKLRGIPAAVVYHSGVGVHNSAPDEARLLASVMRQRPLLAFLEIDQAQWSSRVGVPACGVTSTFAQPPLENLRLRDSRAAWHIGALGLGFRPTVKNFYVQLSSACMLSEPSVIHVNALPKGYTPICKHPIVQHGTLRSREFNALLGQMDLNLYASFTDAVPNSVVHSLAHFVPIILSDVTEWFEGQEELRELLVEPRIDDQFALMQRIERALAYARDNAPRWRKLVRSALLKDHKRALKAWAPFLAGVRHGMLRCHGIPP